METTTIQIRKDQAEQLKTIKAPSGNYKTAIDDLLECYNETTTDAPAGDISGLKESLSTVESRLNSIERTLEEVTRR